MMLSDHDKNDISIHNSVGTQFEDDPSIPHEVFDPFTYEICDD